MQLHSAGQLEAKLELDHRTHVHVYVWNSQCYKTSFLSVSVTKSFL